MTTNSVDSLGKGHSEPDTPASIIMVGRPLQAMGELDSEAGRPLFQFEEVLAGLQAMDELPS